MQDRAKQRYQGAEGKRYQERKRGIPDEAYLWIARLRAEKIPVRPSETVFEFGVGLGWNLAALVCARRIGHDAAEFLASGLIERGIEFLPDPSQQAAGSVDVVVCHHTLEHVWSPPGVLATIHTVLRPAGRLLLFVPYEKERRFRRFQAAEPNHHLYSWNVQTLGNLVQDAGFRIESAGLAPFGQERFAANLACRLGWGERGFRLLHWAANRLKHEVEVRITARKTTSDFAVANLRPRF